MPQPKKDGKGLLNGNHGLGIDSAYPLPEVGTPHCCELVHHDLAELRQTGELSGVNGQPQQRGIRQVSG